VSGTFYNYANYSSPYLVRLLPSGLPDLTFNSYLSINDGPGPDAIFPFAPDTLLLAKRNFAITDKKSN
jgi:hypothetical protein